MINIPEIAFNRKDQQSPGIEIVSFESLRSILGNTSDHDPFKPHRLSFNILLVVTAGEEGEHNIDFKNHAYKERSVILISKDQTHSFIDIPNNNEGYLMMFTEDLFLEIGVNYPFIISHFYNNQLYDPVHTLDKKQFRDLHSLVLKIIEKTHSKKKSVRLELVQSYFKILLLEIFACREMRNKKIEKTSITEDFIKFQLLLKENYVKEKKVKFYAQQLNMSAKKLNAITQSIVNRTAKDFILSHIILEAKKLLVIPNISSKEVAYKLGFEEPTNFTKFFKTHTKMLPSEFINSH